MTECPHITCACACCLRPSTCMRVSVSPVSVVGQQRLDTLRWWRDVHTSRRVRGRPVMWSVVPSSSIEAMSCLHWEAPRGWCLAPSRADCLATSTPLLVAPAACTSEGAAVIRTRGHFVSSCHVYGMPACLPELTRVNTRIADILAWTGGFDGAGSLPLCLAVAGATGRMEE